MPSSGASAIAILQPELQATTLGGFLMKKKSLWLAISNIVALMLAVATGTAARAEGQFFQLSGVINGYTPATIKLGGAGPWEVRGTWSVSLNPYTDTADFSADLTMMRSDLWVSANNQPPDNTALRMAHTHHIALQQVKITMIPNGFRLTGIASITKNGSPAPLTASPLQVDFTGGTSLLISNVALTFLAPNPDPGTAANSHFGSLPILGVVGNP
jgi:hypothetical protein